MEPLALTMGEPAGIGGEIALGAWRALRGSGPAFVLVGDAERLGGPPGGGGRAAAPGGGRRRRGSGPACVLMDDAERFDGLPVARVASPEEAGAVFTSA